jgi:hypothetical protein
MIETYDNCRCDACNKPLGASSGSIYGPDVNDETDNRMYYFCLTCAELLKCRVIKASEEILLSILRNKAKV